MWPVTSKIAYLNVSGFLYEENLLYENFTVWSDCLVLKVFEIKWAWVSGIICNYEPVFVGLYILLPQEELCTQVWHG